MPAHRLSVNRYPASRATEMTVMAMNHRSAMSLSRPTVPSANRAVKMIVMVVSPISRPVVVCAINDQRVIAIIPVVLAIRWIPFYQY